ncbi:hypothetical protein INT47_009449 [Mucor saturninus]|uniref:Uncharacterized protein n=1 Tax=Mucor saturninus TaxID=64648 RepID=A0A8H7UV72_9FUNG|nr:hypothetical protein INT47_009449 [Mucor saturninus]
MKKKTKGKQRSLHEETSKYDFLPPSPPPQIKSVQDSHYQSSSSPVGRPPPFVDGISENDIILLQDLKSMLEGTSSDLGMSQEDEEKPFLIHSPEMDIHLFTEDQFDDMSFDDDTLALFPDLPKSP